MVCSWVKLIPAEVAVVKIVFSVLSYYNKACVYCELSNCGFLYLSISMQHSSFCFAEPPLIDMVVPFTLCCSYY